MAHHVTAISVRNPKGDQLTLYEVWERSRLFGLIADYHLELPTGETVEELDENNFVVVATGERLTRIIR